MSRVNFVSEIQSLHAPCLICGCTEWDACVDEDQQPCGWTSPRYCSACYNLGEHVWYGVAGAGCRPVITWGERLEELARRRPAPMAEDLGNYDIDW